MSAAQYVPKRARYVPDHCVDLLALRAHNLANGKGPFDFAKGIRLVVRFMPEWDGLTPIEMLPNR